MKLGDFTGLAEIYSKYRSDYALQVLNDIFNLLEKEPDQVDAVDVGAGTGIWTRMLAKRGCRSVLAVEPNDDMRTVGIRDCKRMGIDWHKGYGEETGLETSCCDIVTMASAFHWVDYEVAMQEFHRILRPGGWLVALWNPRFLKDHPRQLEIEDHLKTLKPDMHRVSSGSTGLADRLADMFSAHAKFDSVQYFEGFHTVRRTPENYIGVWRSVNDIQTQLGPERFEQFIAYIEDKIEGLPYIDTTYKTRAWVCRSIP